MTQAQCCIYMMPLAVIHSNWDIRATFLSWTGILQIQKYSSGNIEISKLMYWSLLQKQTMKDETTLPSEIKYKTLNN
jgi:hypothetical protein